MKNWAHTNIRVHDGLKYLLYQQFSSIQAPMPVHTVTVMWAYSVVDYLVAA